MGPADVTASDRLVETITDSTNIPEEAASQGNGSVGEHKVTLGSERHILPDKQGKEITNSNDASLEVPETGSVGKHVTVLNEHGADINRFGEFVNHSDQDNTQADVIVLCSPNTHSAVKTGSLFGCRGYNRQVTTKILKIKQTQERKLVTTRQFKMAAYTTDNNWREIEDVKLRSLLPNSQLYFSTRKLETILVHDCETNSYKHQLTVNYLNMETESSKLLQHGHNVERQNLNTTTVDIQALQFIHIEMWTKKWSKTNSSAVNQNTLTGKTKIQQILQARIQYSGLPKHFQHSRTPMEKMKNWKYGEIFFGKNWKN